MLIRGQDKKTLEPLLKLTIKTILKVEAPDYTSLYRSEADQIMRRGVYLIYNGELSIMGEYSTEEKAIKVLDMIQEEYQKPVYQNVVAENEMAMYKGKVFQMPQDEEVIV